MRYGTAEVGEAAEETDDGEADELRGQHLERGGLVQRSEQDRPAPGAQPVAEVGAGEGGEDQRRRDEAELVSERGPVEGGVAAGDPEEEEQKDEDYGEEGAGGEEAAAACGRGGRCFGRHVGGWVGGRHQFSGADGGYCLRCAGLGCSGCGGWSVGQGELAAVELVEDAGDVGAGFAVGRDAVVAVDGGGAGVVGGEGESEAVGVVAGVVAGEELVEVGGAAGDVLVGAEGVVDAELVGGAGHELHEAAGAGAGDGVGVAAAFGLDDAGEEVDVDVVLLAGFG